MFLRLRCRPRRGQASSCKQLTTFDPLFPFPPRQISFFCSLVVSHLCPDSSDLQFMRSPRIAFYVLRSCPSCLAHHADSGLSHLETYSFLFLPRVALISLRFFPHKIFYPFRNIAFHDAFIILESYDRVSLSIECWRVFLCIHKGTTLTIKRSTKWSIFHFGNFSHVELLA